jgi:predicted AAA+ superfamily ATPase
MTLERDVPTIAKLRRANLLPNVLNCLAGQTSEILNVNTIAERIHSSYSTVSDYIRLLEAVFLVFRLEAWDKTLTNRTKRTPKIHMVDSGVAMRLLRLNDKLLATLDPTALTEFGHPLETFVINEVIKEAGWNLDLVAGMGYWSQDKETEVDLVLEGFDGGIVAIEVKATRSVGANHLAGLRALRKKVNDRFIAGVVFCMVPYGYTTSDGIHVLPIDRLWVPN